MIELGLLLLGVIGGIAIGYGWGRIAEREAALTIAHQLTAAYDAGRSQRQHHPLGSGWSIPDPSDEAGA